MLRRTIVLNAETQTESVLTNLRRDCTTQHLEADQADVVVSVVEDAMEKLLQRGREVATVGGQFRATRELRGETYSIKLKAQFGGAEEGFIRRVLRMFHLSRG